MENLQSLTKAVINISACKTFRADATTIFKGICDVPSLVLSDTSLELLLRCEPLPVFANLIRLDLPCHLRFRYSNPLQKGLETLLSSLPALEKLEFYQEVLCSLPEEVPSCLLHKLKTIKITNFTDEKYCIGKVKYILKNGGVLEKLIIVTASHISSSCICNSTTYMANLSIEFSATTIST
ncbi:hypothetical protein V6Z11_A01G082500 [Gossypium hirsutum]